MINVKQTITILSVFFIILITSCQKKHIPLDAAALATPTPFNTSTETNTETFTGTYTPVLTYTPTELLTPADTATVTETPTTAPDNSYYHFEGGTNMGWTTPLNGHITGTANSMDRAYLGTHSLRVDGAFVSSEGNGIAVNGPLLTDITGMELHMFVWLPPDFGAAGGALYVMTGSSWCWEQGDWVNYIAGQWNEVIIDMDLVSSACGADHADVKAIGVMIQPASDYTGSIYIDSLSYFQEGSPTESYTVTDTFTQTYTITDTETPGGDTKTDTATITNTYTPTETATVIYTPGKPNDPNIQYYGRWDKSNPDEYTSGWGVSYIKAAFTGTSIAIKQSAWNQWFGYAIDSTDHFNFTKFQQKDQMDASTPVATQTPLMITGLADTTHTITLVKRTDAFGGNNTFYGFDLDPGDSLVYAGPVPQRKMEFIGDSITSGSYTEWEGSNPCPEDWGNCIMNGDLSFGPQLARMLNAQFHVASRGGIGIYRNCSGCDPQDTMPVVYPKILWSYTPAAESPWDFNLYQPDVVIIALGTNDFSAGTPDETEFKTAYSNFVDTVRTNYPYAYILCTEPIPSWVPVTAGTWINYVVDSKGDNRIRYVPINNPATAPYTPLPVSDYANDNTHPIVSAHTKIANLLYDWINANLMADLQATNGW